MNSPALPDNPIVRIRDLHYLRGERSIFSGINLEIPRGKITAILGPSGTGKTTLLRLIGGQLAPTAGTVEVEGRDLQALTQRELFAQRKRMGMLFQSGALLTDLNLYENVAFPLREHTDLPESLLRSLVLMKLDMVGLRSARNLYPRELSGGMARRAALARAIALDPSMILYDEPFSGQDPISMGMLVRLIRELNDALGHTSILVSHDVVETSSIADYLFILSGSHIVGAGTPAELHASESPVIRQFMGGLPDGPVPFDYPGSPYFEDLLGDAR